ncbi:hypothetical protein SAMN05216184_104110 [Georgenia satyanarayanai]|uniref:Uncharacterized protein n=1 Tax=Georgenia satyanarayanai TaxID=860221 RepID=A0A2Y9AAY6_9MICO|nr:hypothetical protein [Georgenia satyanarayanai]PYG00171.1 hypothetical protein A8987_104110 [Georgenia satyanarayanai]SSA40398.1 hypothetical protein SAMN05216184_104110 [Georgenia satyanarayanai]
MTDIKGTLRAGEYVVPADAVEPCILVVDHVLGEKEPRTYCARRSCQCRRPAKEDGTVEVRGD